MATMPSETGSCALAAECAIGADPWPASLENKPLFTPLLKVNAKPAPRNPPAAAVPVKASVKMEASEGPIF